jgi:redox-sensing transcriptional repressor
MPQPGIPDIVIGRLPVYLRTLRRLQQEGLEYTSSRELGQRLGISSAQIRKDLSHFGEFGKQGTGYNIGFLSEALQQILHVDREWQVALVGVGKLGQALADYGGFAHRGFRITHLFDNDPSKVGSTVGGLEILPAERITDTVRAAGIHVAMITTPAEAAQSVADQLVRGGVHAILSYAPIIISVPAPVRVQYIDPVVHMQRMTFYLR